MIGFLKKDLVGGLISKSPSQTQKLGEKIAANLAGGELIALSGDLGSGKTTFVQGLAKGLGVKGRIISPTFILMRKYSIKLQNSKTLKLKDFYHVDLYRLEENIGEEVTNLGLFDLLGKRENVVAIEWADKIKKSIPKSVNSISFENLGGNKRKIIIGE